MGSFNKTYKISSNSLTKVLTGLDELSTVIDTFKQKHNQYNYTTQISQEDEVWVATVTVNTHEEYENVKTS